ncbi:hypothetical protein FVEG_15821 [Fusarium verticillioides 7600]|uniref:Uncharacterized protein n=1 Tax=Gibberella moniliformis (strain M3125 / FGSC 7600) TaxID=334819 RepID=W7MCT3_GIBM7|nr:hypothetical protein FVEG_15821 [Fusarium verticillioides 7600]EWG45410.1 hypothetical protein FVEG_15821 [Fusarium verticillioides 7600]
MLCMKDYNPPSLTNRPTTTHHLFHKSRTHLCIDNATFAVNSFFMNPMSISPNDVAQDCARHGKLVLADPDSLCNSTQSPSVFRSLLAMISVILSGQRGGQTFRADEMCPHEYLSGRATDVHIIDGILRCDVTTQLQELAGRC